MITVKQDTRNGKLFENLEVGATFECKDRYFVKIYECSTSVGLAVNAVNMATGEIHQFAATDMVYPFDADLVIKRKES